MKLFISVGSVEALTQPVKNFIQVVRNRSYNGLKMEARIIEDERHAGNKPEAFNRGLRFVFREDKTPINYRVFDKVRDGKTGSF